jgi:hypothetical protein
MKNSTPQVRFDAASPLTADFRGRENKLHFARSCALPETVSGE